MKKKACLQHRITLAFFISFHKSQKQSHTKMNNETESIELCLHTTGETTTNTETNDKRKTNKKEKIRRKR